MFEHATVPVTPFEHSSTTHQCGHTLSLPSTPIHIRLHLLKVSTYLTNYCYLRNEWNILNSLKDGRLVAVHNNRRLSMINDLSKSL